MSRLVRASARFAILGSSFALALMSLPNPVAATPGSELSAIDATLKTCLAKQVNEAAIRDCIASADQAADKVLRGVYQTLTDRLKHTKPDGEAADDAETLKRLIAAERAWIAFRDAECDFQGTTMLGGTGENTEIENCLFERTRDRAKVLDAYLQQRG